MNDESDDYGPELIPEPASKLKKSSTLIPQTSIKSFNIATIGHDDLMDPEQLYAIDTPNRNQGKSPKTSARGAPATSARKQVTAFE